MSTAAATDAAPPAKGKKKLIIMAGGGALVVVLALVAFLMMGKKPPPEEEGGAEASAKPAAAAMPKFDPKAVPIFVPLDPFTVNLADRDAERYAQVGITLEITDAQLNERIKVYMPAIRNNILMAIADKTAADLATREGKAALAEKVKRETSKALGFEVEEEEEPEEEASTTKKKKKKRAPPPLPINNVHFSNFIIQ
jgi:flagellar FliL protein